jgi:hypothetical protein
MNRMPRVAQKTSSGKSAESSSLATERKRVSELLELVEENSGIIIKIREYIVDYS